MTAVVRRMHWLVLVLTTIGSSCSKSSSEAQEGAELPPPPSWNDDCDPLVPSHCGFPFPSNTALVDDASTKTGKRVAFKGTVLPKHSNVPTNPASWDDIDGFSPGMNLITFMPGASVTGLPTQDDIERSIGPDSPTIVIDAQTGERLPHFAEIDVQPQHEDERAFMIRPMVRMKDATRYIVAIRHVVDAQGRTIRVSPAFKALRDGTPFAHPSIEKRRTLYAEIFQKLEAAGISRKDLQIAWDFSTASRENNTRWMIAMRDDALAKVGADGPEYVIDKVIENPSEHIRRRLLGRMTVPLYLDKAEKGGRMVFGPDKMPKQNGTAQFEFVMHIPHAATKGTPGALLQNGHGLLGSKDEGQDGYLAVIADAKNYVAFAVDWVGMAHEDIPTLTDTIVGDIGDFRAIVERQHQGMINALLAMRMMKGRMVRDPNLQFDGKSVIDPTRCHYRGDSQGGIFGTTYMAITTDVTRGLLSVPGAPYSLLLDRSKDFIPFHFLVGLPYSDDLDTQIILGMVQMLWDRSEPNGYIPYIVDNPLPGTPKHEVLLHVAIGDQQVTPLGAHFTARTIHAKGVAPMTRKVFGIPESSPPFSGSAIVEFEFGNPEAPKTNEPPRLGEDPHDKVRSLPSAYGQADKFFREGIVQHFCTGICDPE